MLPAGLKNVLWFRLEPKCSAELLKTPWHCGGGKGRAQKCNHSILLKGSDYAFAGFFDEGPFTDHSAKGTIADNE